MKKTNKVLITLAALALALSPNLVLAQRTPITGGHMRNASFHDRTPRAHDHSSVAHH